MISRFIVYTLAIIIMLGYIIYHTILVALTAVLILLNNILVYK